MFFRSIARRQFAAQIPAVVQVNLKHLPFEMGALEPVMSGLLLDYHYGKHHRAYVNNLNAALEKQYDAMYKGDLKESIKMEKLVRFNGGGHFNHEFFWDSLCSKKDSALPEAGSVLHTHITKNFSSLDNFIKVFNKETASIMGSGWGWLVYNKKNGRLMFRQTKDQDLISDNHSNSIPLLNIDIWEHAYYIDYKNSRP